MTSVLKPEGVAVRCRRGRRSARHDCRATRLLWCSDWGNDLRGCCQLTLDRRQAPCGDARHWRLRRNEACRGRHRPEVRHVIRRGAMAELVATAECRHQADTQDQATPATKRALSHLGSRAGRRGQMQVQMNSPVIGALVARPRYRTGW